MLRAYLLLLAHLDRDPTAVPPELQADMRETLRLVPILCEEFVKASTSPRNRMMRVRALSVTHTGYPGT